MNDRKCYICGKLLDNEENYVIRFTDESFDLCELHYQTSKKMLAHIDRRKKELEGKICCKNYGKNCEYNSAWFCTDALYCDNYCNHIVSTDMHALAANMILRGEY